MARARVLFFAGARDAVGCETGEVAWEGEGELTLAIFWTHLAEQFPGLAVFRSTARLARNYEYLNDGDAIVPGDELALIPPVSGG
jgi:molybdopterin converting factor small subunit